MKEKTKGLLINVALYLGAFAVGFIPYIFVENIFLASALFTLAATLVIYIVTCFYPDTSLYDPYWSVEPPVILLINMIRFELWNVNSIMMLGAVLIWSVRLTANWYITYKGLGHEDWRYAMYRQKCSKPVFALINFVGLQYVPTIVVYAGLVSGFFVIQNTEFNPLCLIGYAVMLAAVVLELTADTAVHGFLRDNKGKHITCDRSVWKYSRHPNYLGEMSFWTGMALVYILTSLEQWYYGLGFILIIILFCTVSIPMMEKHNMERRPDYEEYKKHTSVLLLLPRK